MTNVSRAGVGLYITLIEVLLAAAGITLPEGSVTALVNDIVEVLGILFIIWGQLSRKDLHFGLFRK